MTNILFHTDLLIHTAATTTAMAGPGGWNCHFIIVRYEPCIHCSYTAHE